MWMNYVETRKYSPFDWTVSAATHVWLYRKQQQTTQKSEGRLLFFCFIFLLCFQFSSLRRALTTQRLRYKYMSTKERMHESNSHCILNAISSAPLLFPDTYSQIQPSDVDFACLPPPPPLYRVDDNLTVYCARLLLSRFSCSSRFGFSFPLKWKLVLPPHTTDVGATRTVTIQQRTISQREFIQCGWMHAMYLTCCSNHFVEFSLHMWLATDEVSLVILDSNISSICFLYSARASFFSLYPSFSLSLCLFLIFLDISYE